MVYRGIEGRKDRENPCCLVEPPLEPVQGPPGTRPTELHPAAHDPGAFPEAMAQQFTPIQPSVGMGLCGSLIQARRC
jgi:hypothetical protein